MSHDTQIRTQLAALIFTMTNAVVFGAGIITVLTVPALSAHAFFWIPAVVAASVLVAAPLSWFLAPRLRARYWRHRQATAPDNVDPLHIG